MRIKDRGEEMELGIRTLLRGAIPARLRTREGNNVSPFFDVVIGESHDGKRAVVAPAVSALRSGEPNLEIAGRNISAERGANLAQSRYLDAFVVELRGPEAAAALEEAGRIAANPPRRAAPAPAGAGTARPASAPEKKAREERIQDLMTKTGLSRADAEFIAAAELEAEGFEEP